MALILLEGVSGGGKSTLANRIVDSFTFLTEDEPDPPRIVRVSSGKPIPNLDAFQEFELPLERMDLHGLIRSKADLVVIDGWAAKDAAYGPLYHNHSRLDGAGMLHVEFTLDTLGAVKVLAQPDNPSIVKMRLEDQGASTLRTQSVNQVHRWFEGHGKRYGYIRGVETSPSELIQLAKRQALGDSPGAPRGWMGYVGSASPRLLLVGDGKDDGPRDRHESVRAFTPHPGSSAHYLLKTLDHGGIRQGVGLVNAHEPGIGLSFVDKLFPRPVVVALGYRASRMLYSRGVEHKTVAHPRYRRRFRPNDMDSYAMKIREAAQWE